MFARVGLSLKLALMFVVVVLVLGICFLQSDLLAKKPGNGGGGNGGGGNGGGPRVISFAGHDWTVKDAGEGKVGPGPNYFSNSAETVWFDADGRLHLRIERRR